MNTGDGCNTGIMGRECSKWITHCASRFHGEQWSAQERPPFTWAELSVKSRSRSKQCATANTRNVLLFCLHNHRCSIAQELPQVCKRRGHIATCQTVQRSTCCRDWKVRLNDSLPDLGIAFWPDGSSLRQRCNPWTQT